MDKKWFLVIGIVIGLVFGVASTITIYALISQKGKTNTQLTSKEETSTFLPTLKMVGLEKDPENYVFKVDGIGMSKKDFESLFVVYTNYVLKGVSMEELAKQGYDVQMLKKQFLNDLVINTLVILEFLNSNLTNSQDWKYLSKILLRKMIQDYYQTYYIEQHQDAIQVSKKEVDMEYMKNKAQYDKLGLSTEELRKRIEASIKLRKLQQLLEEWKNTLEEKYKIEKKPEALN